MGLFGSPDIKKLKEKRDVNGLIKALTYQKSLTVRADAARALGELRDARAIMPLSAALNEESINVQAAATKALRQLLKALNEMGWQPSKDEAGAAYWIGKQNWQESIRIGAPAVVPLIAVLNRTWKEEGAVAEALGKIGDARAVKPLIAVLKNTISL